MIKILLILQVLGTFIPPLAPSTVDPITLITTKIAAKLDPFGIGAALAAAAAAGK